MEEGEWAVVKASSAHESREPQPLDPGLMKDLGCQVIKSKKKNKKKKNCVHGQMVMVGPTT